MKLRRFVTPVLFAAVALLSACGSEPQPAADANGSPLSYAPADTPYVFGMIQPMPAELVDRFMKRGDRMGELYAAQFQKLRGQLAKKGGDDATRKFVEALATEFEGKSLSQSMALFGVDGHQRMAFYGIGLVPVLRMELADPAALPALVGRLEQSVGEQLPKGEVDGQSYWAIDFGDKTTPLILLTAVVGNQLVMSIAPQHADDATLRTLLGMAPPAQRLLDSDRLTRLQSQHHLLPEMLGEVDSQRILDTLSAPATPLETAFMASMKIQKPEISAECRGEYGKLAGLVPRIAVGYTRIDAEHMDQVNILELAPDLANALLPLRSPMPGMGAVNDDTAVDFGYALKLSSIPPLAGKFAQAVNSAPFKCESLGWLNEAAKQAPEAGNNPGIYMTAPMFSGIHAIVDKLALNDDMKPTELRGSVLIGSDNPQSLLGMARQYVPQLSSLEVKTDGSLQKLDLPPIPDLDMQVPAWVSASQNMVGIAFGEGADGEISARMQSDPAQQPLFVMGYNGKLYVDMMQKLMQKAASEAKSDEERVEMERVSTMMKEIYGEWIRRFSIRLDLTEQGLVLTQNITTNP